MSARVWPARPAKAAAPSRCHVGLQRALQLWLIYCFLSGFLLGAGIA